MKDFKDKVLVVTGAGFGIGRAIAIEGAQRGMKVVINDICAESLAETKKLIEEIGTVTEDSGDAIKKAETAYDKLSATEKIYVKNYDTLTKARKQFEKKK